MTTQTKLKIPIVVSLSALLLSVIMIALACIIDPNSKLLFNITAGLLLTTAASFILWTLMSICIGNRD